MSESLPLSVVARPKGPAFLKAFAASARSALANMPGIAVVESSDGLLIKGLWEPDIERAVEALRQTSKDEVLCSDLKIHYIEGQRVLEPVLNLTVVVPEDFLGSVFGDLNARRGVIQSAQDGPGDRKTLEVHVPLSELIGYHTVLRRLSQGQATVTAVLVGYQEIPHLPPSGPHGPKANVMRA